MLFCFITMISWTVVDGDGWVTDRRAWCVRKEERKEKREKIRRLSRVTWHRVRVVVLIFLQFSIFAFISIQFSYLARPR